MRKVVHHLDVGNFSDVLSDASKLAISLPEIIVSVPWTRWGIRYQHPESKDSLDADIQANFLRNEILSSNLECRLPWGQQFQERTQPDGDGVFRIIGICICISDLTVLSFSPHELQFLWC